MEQSFNHQNPLLSLLPLLILMIPMIFIIRRLAREKGKDVILWTVLACIPFVNFIVLPYIIGTPSKILEEKMDRIIDALKQPDEK